MDNDTTFFQETIKTKLVELKVKYAIFISIASFVVYNIVDYKFDFLLLVLFCIALYSAGGATVIHFDIRKYINICKTKMDNIDTIKMDLDLHRTYLTIVYSCPTPIFLWSLQKLLISTDFKLSIMLSVACTLLCTEYVKRIKERIHKLSQQLVD